ncbi:phospholipase D-like domain-containing protein [Streptomyces sp. NPDC008122]|uniref:phospholipase D-like domain-containing protein n=1 Tax=Streptomyces sp. NPDC008122 TaxID=3364810 RepID=UPI0036E8E828
MGRNPRAPARVAPESENRRELHAHPARAPRRLPGGGAPGLGPHRLRLVRLRLARLRLAAKVPNHNYYGVPDRKIVWTGSHNWSTNSLRQSDETMLQFEGPAIHDAYVADYNKLRASTTHRPANGDAVDATC